MNEDLQQRVAAIEARNRRVDGDKAWEISLARRVTITLVTYLIVVAYSWAIGAQRPYLQAVVPAVGFLLSTVTVPLVKRRWIDLRHSRRS